MLRILHFLTHRTPTLPIGNMVTPPPTPPWSMLFSREQKYSDHPSTLCFGGGGESILSEAGFKGKYSKIRHITCIFLNMDVIPLRLFVKLFICLFIYAMAKNRQFKYQSGQRCDRNKKPNNYRARTGPPSFQILLSHARYVLSSKLEVEEKQRALSMPLCNK